MGCGESKSAATKQAAPVQQAAERPPAAGPPAPANVTVSPPTSLSATSSQPLEASEKASAQVVVAPPPPAAEKLQAAIEDEPPHVTAHTPRDQMVSGRQGAAYVDSFPPVGVDASPSRLAVEADVDVADLRHTPSMRRLQGAQLWSATANRYPESAKALYKAGMSLQPGERLHLAKFPAGLDKQQALLESIRLHDGLAAPYVALGNSLRSAGETVRLPDGTDATRQELYLRAVNREPWNAVAWYSLGNTIALNDTICLLPFPAAETFAGPKVGSHPRGAVGKLDCYGMAIFCDDSFAAPVRLAASNAGDGRSVPLPDGSRLSRKDLLVRLNRLEPSARTATALSECVGLAETVRLHDGAEYSKKELLVRAIALDDGFAEAYHALMPLLSKEEMLPLEPPPSTRCVSKRICCIKIIELDGERSGVAYATLSGLMKQRDDCVTLADGRCLTQRSASLAALKATPWAETAQTPGGSAVNGEAVNSRVSSDGEDSEPEAVEPHEM
jgi:hypothetical protein